MGLYIQPAVLFDGDLFHDDIFHRPIGGVSDDFADGFYDIQPFDDFAEDGMAIIEMRCGAQRDEEL